MTKTGALLTPLFLLALGCGDDASSSPTGGGEGEGGEPERCADIVQGDVRLTSDEELATLEGVVQVNGELRVSGGVTSLSGLSCLEGVAGRLIFERTELRDLSGLENLVEAEELVLQGNTELVSTAGLGVQRLIGEPDELSGLNSSLSRVMENPNLTEIRFDSLREMGSISIGSCGGVDGNRSLAEMSEAAFPLLESGVTLSVGANQSLVSVDGMVRSFAGASPFMLVSFMDNEKLDGPGLQETWGEAGLAELLRTCGNSGDSQACECPFGE